MAIGGAGGRLIPTGPKVKGWTGQVLAWTGNTLAVWGSDVLPTINPKKAFVWFVKDLLGRDLGKMKIDLKAYKL